MKPLSLLLKFIFGAAILTTFCASASQNEGNFQPSPNGQFVVSVVNSELSIPIPTEGLELSASVSVRIRDSKGEELFSVPVAKGQKSYEIGYGYVSTAWSPDSRTLAYCNQGNLSVVEVSGNHQTHKLLQSVSSFRWTGNSNLCCIIGPLEDDGLFAVKEVPTASGIGIARLTNVKATAFHPYVSEYHNQLSPDSRNVVFIDGTRILISNFSDTNKESVMQRKLTPSFNWWNDTSKRCLVHGLEHVKTTKSWPDDTMLLDVIYLYETNSSSFTDLTTNLQQLNEDPNLSAPRPIAEDRVWSPDGNWFLVSGGWICVPKPWSAVRVGEMYRKGFHNPKVAPTGSKIGIICSSDDFAPSGDLYVIDVQIEYNDKPTLGSPRKVASGVPFSWFWSVDGRQLVVWNGRKFNYYPASDKQ